MGQELSARAEKVIQLRESTYGTDAVNAALEANSALRWDAFTQSDVTMNGEFRGREFTRPAFGFSRGKYVPRNLTFAMGGIVPIPATSGDAPLGLADYLVASGYAETLVDNTTATYAPSTTAISGLSIYAFKRNVDDYTHRLIYGTGVRGSTTIAGSVNDFLTWQFTGQSINFPRTDTLTSAPFGWSLDKAFFAADGTILLASDGDTPAGTWDGTAAETTDDQNGLLLEPSSVVTINSVVYTISSFTLNLGATVSNRQRTSSTTTSGPTIITGRGTTLDLVLDRSGVDFEDALDALRDSREASATIVVTDGLGSGGTTLTITMPKLQPRGITQAEAEGLVTHSIPFQCNGTWTDGLGDDECTLTWSVTA